MLSASLHEQASRIADTYPTQPGTQDTDWLACAQHVAQLAEAERGTGRPTAMLDIYRIQKFLTRCAKGNHPAVAALAAGFAKQTYYDWQQAAKDGGSAAIALMDYVEKASAEDECETNEDVRKAQKHPQFWAAGMTRLERRFPERWGKRTEDSNGPRVLVQIGVRDSDVSVTQVTIAQQSACINALSPDPAQHLPQLSTGQVDIQRPIISVPLAETTANPPAIPGARSPEGPSPARPRVRRGRASSAKSALAVGKEKRG